MHDADFVTLQLHDWQKRIAQSHAAVRDGMVFATRSRLETHTRHMLRKLALSDGEAVA